MFQKAANGVSLALAGPSTTPLLADIEVPDSTIFAGTRSMAGRLRVLTSSMYAFFERTLSWYELLGAELIEVPVLARAQAALWDSIRQQYARALAGSDGDLLAKTTAGLLHPGRSVR